jgi:hypothetical protein
MLIVSILTSLGGHWIVLQSVAWTTMVFTNAKHANLSQALEKTFDGNHPCPLCKCIEKGRASEKKPEARIAASKMNLFFETGSVILLHPLNYRRQPSPDTFACDRSQKPLLQPPREPLS